MTTKNIINNLQEIDEGFSHACRSLVDSLRDRRLRKAKEKAVYWKGKAEIYKILCSGLHSGFERELWSEATAKYYKYQSKVNSLLEAELPEPIGWESSIPLSLYSDGRNPYPEITPEILGNLLIDNDPEWEDKAIKWMKEAEAKGRLISDPLSYRPIFSDPLVSTNE